MTTLSATELAELLGQALDRLDVPERLLDDLEVGR